MSPIIQGIGISRQVGGKRLLHPTDCIIHPGDRIGVRGTSGSGKSVLLRTLALLDHPDTGQILHAGKAVSSVGDIVAYRIRTAYIRQQPALMPGTVRDNLDIPFRLAAYRHRKLDEALIEAMLKSVHRDSSFLESDSANLSGGEAQIVCLMRVLQLNPQVLLLDEPTAALDPESAAAVEKLVDDWLAKRPDGAYVWISHSPEQLSRIARTVWTVHQGMLNTGADWHA